MTVGISHIGCQCFADIAELSGLDELVVVVHQVGVDPSLKSLFLSPLPVELIAYFNVVQCFRQGLFACAGICVVVTCGFAMGTSIRGVDVVILCAPAQSCLRIEEGETLVDIERLLRVIVEVLVICACDAVIDIAELHVGVGQQMLRDVVLGFGKGSRIAFCGITIVIISFQRLWVVACKGHHTPMRTVEAAE